MAQVQKLGDAVTLLTAATSATAAATRTVTAARGVVVAITWASGTTGSVAITGSIDGTNFGSLSTPTASAGDTTLVHLADLPLNTIKVDPAGLTAGSVTVKIAEVS